VTVRDLPTLNAGLNATSAVLLLIGYVLIRKRRREAHEKIMLAALLSSTLFLVSYVVYHVQVGSVRFPLTGWIRGAYLFILITHVVLAAAIVPLVVVTSVRALRRRFDAHRRIARVTLPLWGYVSVTGVVVYWMLYHLPSQGLIK
jgi:uncharacterized membrane protein YozB (DUF420 family)